MTYDHEATIRHAKRMALKVMTWPSWKLRDLQFFNSSQVSQTLTLDPKADRMSDPNTTVAPQETMDSACAERWISKLESDWERTKDSDNVAPEFLELLMTLCQSWNYPEEFKNRSEDFVHAVSTKLEAMRNASTP